MINLVCTSLQVNSLSFVFGLVCSPVGLKAGLVDPVKGMIRRSLNCLDIGGDALLYTRMPLFVLLNSKIQRECSALFYYTHEPGMGHP